jgi:hypothetical protein
MSTFTSEPGTRLGGRYRLEDRLAAASGWAAWKAIDEILARPVSVITFAAGFPRLQQVVTAARAASRLTDTRLTQVFDVEDSWDHPYIVLEWPVGDTLSDLLADGTIDAASGVRIVSEAASAIAGAHAAGIAHLCLQPEAVRWTTGGGLKLTGLGIDAALAGITADDPELTDTRGLGSLLYAALTGMWPEQDHPYLPAAPLSDGQPRRPRQVRAGVPTVLDDITARALGLGGRDSQPFTSTRELAQALAAVIPPLPLPPAAAQARREPRATPRRDTRPGQRQDGRWDTPARGSAAEARGTSARGGQSQPRSGSRLAVVAVVALVAIVGLSAAAAKLLHSPAPSHARGHHSSSTGHTAKSAPLQPIAAEGFDALRTSAQDPTDENSSLAINLIDHNPSGWQTQQYYGSSNFGNLKSGSGLLLDMGKAVRVTSVLIKFGSQPGANVEIKVGDSDVRSAANEESMTTVASANDVFGSHMFTIAKPVTDRYLVVWFTNLPPLAHAQGKYMAQIFTIIVSGTG